MNDLAALARKPKKGFLQSEVAINKMLNFVTTIPDPDELLSKAGIKRYQLRQLELDDEVAQAIDTRREAVVATPWRIEPNQNRVGKWLTSVLDPHIETLKRGCLDARFYGYSVFEVIYAPVEKGIGLNRLSLKPMEWFAPQLDGTLRYFPNDGSGGVEGVVCDPFKFLLTTCNATYRNPYGEALLSRLWFPVTWRRESWQMWLQFLETFGEPIILGMVQNYTEFVEAMTAQGVRSTVAWQSVTGEDKVEPITASTPGEFERLENAILRRIQKLILGQTLTSDVGSNGSYAVAAIHNEVRNDKRRADMRMVQATGQKLVNNLALINGFDPPKFIMADDSGLEMHRAQRDSVLAPILAASGFKYSKQYYLDRFDLNEDDLEEEEVMEPTTPEAEVMPTKDSLDDNGERKAPTRDRSVVDEAMAVLIGESND
jgi:phage gp29-like protein